MSHLYAFTIGGHTYGNPDADDSGLVLDGKKAALQNVLPRGLRVFSYRHDLAASWEHALQIEAVSAYDPGKHGPSCLAGEGRLPLSVSGGGDAAGRGMASSWPGEPDLVDINRRLDFLFSGHGERQRRRQS